LPDVHVYVNRPLEKESPGLEDAEGAVKRLAYVFEVRADPAGNVLAVSFEGGREEQEGLERAIEEVGYRVSRRSVRTTFQTE
jgi:hypothetical protein